MHSNEKLPVHDMNQKDNISINILMLQTELLPFDAKQCQFKIQPKFKVNMEGELVSGTFLNTVQLSIYENTTIRSRPTGARQRQNRRRESQISGTLPAFK